MQFASDALYAPQIAPGVPAARLPQSFGVRVYRWLDRIAPASFVEDGLAAQALARGDTDSAEHYAVRMPASKRRDQMLARIAQARGQSVLADEYFFAADDITELQQRVAQRAKTDIYGAIALEGRIRARLIALRTHPDAVANSYWMSGNYRTWLHEYGPALRDYRRAEALAPLDARYILAVANLAYVAGDLATARAAFEHGRLVDPGSGDMLCGLGMVALREGRRQQARAYLAQARALDPHAEMIPALERALR